ncbi:MAG: tRNA dihydrouridine synthase DusB [Elusimicrobiota bacterium]
MRDEGRPQGLTPLRLKGLALESAVWQSPMADCTDLPFRLLAREHGLRFAFLEMVSADSLLRRNRKTLEMMRTHPSDRPLGAQLMGGDPAMLAEAAALVEEMGFDLVDINMGCPAPKVAGGARAGSALLRDPERAGCIIAAAARRLRRIPLTVKMRIGFDDPSGKEAVELARRAEGAGACAVIVHGRTRAQAYGGLADYAAIGRVKAAVRVPVVGNGDVFTGGDALRLAAESGCDAVMIGRGGLGNPWLYREIECALAGKAAPARPSFEERRSTALRHMELERQVRGEERAVLYMRRIACWHFPGIPKAAAFRRAVCGAKDLAEVERLIQALPESR